ncbi:MAG: TonB-dependent siderophore receptor [Methylotenera sp.]|nr:TonB-dependent siderophore receptor [Methylotenera sp.]MDO9389448.1 TonB-dependent siderophore receptor [Methylotenera sp.]MDP2102955.1 TonB-dependent siderophore receptor [Methylotenera sp.]MDP2282206.1 TonB-dependent siderophore receptor [Methylotenera sp.]MDP3059843.1 TonB-dependent siderophore receptor [Methylotenera sp.]
MHYSLKNKSLAMAILLALPAISSYAEEVESTLPEVAVSAKKDEKEDKFITQDRATNVGKSPVSIQDSPQSITVVDVEQAREMGALNIQDALTYSSGVYSGNFGFDTRIDSTRIRGLSPSLFLNGLRTLYGFYNNTRDDIYTLESIEVLKGPSSSLFGQSDLGGIVNLVSKMPKEKASKEINVQYGMYDRKQIGFDFTGPITDDGTLLYRVVAMKRDSGTQVDYVKDDALIFMPSITWRPSDKTSITLQYLHQDVDSTVSAQFLPSRGTIQSAPLGKISSSTFVGEPGWDRYDMKRDELSLFVDQKFTDNLKLVASLRKTNSSSETREHWTRVGAIPDNAGNMQRTIHTADRNTHVFSADTRLQADLNLGPTKHIASFGVDYQDALWTESNFASTTSAFGINVYNQVYGNVDYSKLVGAERNNNKIVQAGFYLSDHMEWGPVVISAALRRDHATNTLLQFNKSIPDTDARNSATTGRVGLMYRFNNGLSPFINYSEAFVPNLGGDGAGGILKPTEGEQREAGLKFLSNDGNSSANFATFEIEQINRIQQGAIPGGVEQVGAVTKGWELEAKHRIGKLELMGNYTRMNAFNDTTKIRLPYVAEKLGSAWAQYRINEHWRAGVGTRYIGDTVGGGGLPTVDSVTLFDAMVGINYGAWDVRATIRNIADKEFISWCRGNNQDCGFGERQNAVLSANYNF